MHTITITIPGKAVLAFDLDPESGEDDEVSIDIDGHDAAGITGDGKVIVWNVDSGEHTVVFTPFDPDDVGPGWLVDQTYGNTIPPDGYVSVQRDDEADIFPGDIEAAQAYARANGGGEVLCIVGSEGPGVLAPQSDVMVRLRRGSTDTHWITEAEAAARDIYERPSDAG